MVEKYGFSLLAFIQASSGCFKALTRGSRDSLYEGVMVPRDSFMGCAAWLVLLMDKILHYPL